MSFSLLAAIFGMYYNVKNPKYDWITDIQLYKQSMCVFVCMFGGMVLVGAALAGMFIFMNTISPLIYGWIISVCLLILSFIFYRLLTKCELISN